MEFVVAFLVFWGMVVVIAVGNIIAERQSPPDMTPGSNDSGTDCVGLCLQFNNRRSERCMAQADVANAQARVNTLSAQRDSAQSAWTVASAAAIAAMFIPFIGPIISSGFATAAAIAFTAFLALVGAVNGASSDLIEKTAVARTTMDREAEARQLLLANCPKEASACLATPSPC